MPASHLELELEHTTQVHSRRRRSGAHGWIRHCRGLQDLREGDHGLLSPGHLRALQHHHERFVAPMAPSTVRPMAMFGLIALLVAMTGPVQAAKKQIRVSALAPAPPRLPTTPSRSADLGAVRLASVFRLADTARKRTPPSPTQPTHATYTHEHAGALQCQVEGKPCDGPKNTKCCKELKCAGEGSQWYPKDEYDEDVCTLQISWPERYAMGHLFLEKFRPNMNEVRQGARLRPGWR